MKIHSELSLSPQTEIAPCAVFGVCGGCSYQNVSYTAELALKQEQLSNLFHHSLQIPTSQIATVVPSPKLYSYRHRLDLALRRTKAGEILVGFMPPQGPPKIISIDSCPIAEKSVSDFIPQLTSEAIARLPLKYRAANLTVKTDETGKVLWGGIGKGSLKRGPEDYFEITLNKKKIYYALDTFFQANLSILPLLAQTLLNLNLWTPQTQFLDLYGGVGLFSLIVSDQVQKVWLIEENPASLKLAKHNFEANQIHNFEIISQRMETAILNWQVSFDPHPTVAMVDPPRKGLGKDVSNFLSHQTRLNNLLYLSCNPTSLIEDLKVFLAQGWEIQTIIPFDFFPRTRHLEVLVWLRPYHKNSSTLKN